MSNNTFALILAGGSGTRMGNPDKPKQYLMLGGKPVLIHTVEKFCVAADFKAIYILCPQAWVQQTQDLVKHHLPQYANVHVAAGGPTRNETIMAGIDAIDAAHGLTDDTVIVTHDAVRPFVSHRIIRENIEIMASCDACDTVIEATDTIVESASGDYITSIPDRSVCYQGQTPQSFKAARLKDLYASLSDNEKEILTDACKIFVLKGEKVALVRGDVANIKITYPHDMRVAKAMMEQDELAEEQMAEEADA